MLIPEHPLWRTINTRESNGYWVAQPVQWVDSVEKEFDSVRHGIDVEGRVVHARRMYASKFVLFGNGFYDVRQSLPPKVAKQVIAESKS